MSQIIDFSKLFNYSYLTQNPEAGSKYAVFLLIFFVVSVIFGFVFSFLLEKKTYPKFYKKFLRRLSDFFIYMPIIGILLVLTRIAGISGISQRIYLLSTLIIWLIWLIFLVYYRLVILSKLWRSYYDRKREEGYLRNGKRKNS